LIHLKIGLWYLSTPRPGAHSRATPQGWACDKCQARVSEASSTQLQYISSSPHLYQRQCHRYRAEASIVQMQASHALQSRHLAPASSLLQQESRAVARPIAVLNRPPIRLSLSQSQDQLLLLATTHLSSFGPTIHPNLKAPKPQQQVTKSPAQPAHTKSSD
jgi:hypothetical protein